MRRTVLCFVFDGPERLLMILKKRGMGAGKWNFPGGKIAPGESAEAAALRETLEETGIEPGGLRPVGQLEFRFPEGSSSWSNACTVFRADTFHGQLTGESEECSSAWVDVKKIPYDKMWADDVRWVPLLLAGQPFHRIYHFDAHNELLREEIADA